MKQIAIALALVGAGTIGLANTSHAMTLPAPSALKEAVPSNASQAFWRGGGWGPGIGFGIAAGALTAAAVASSPYWGGGYWGGYPGYGYAPAYGYGYGWGWHAGFGFFGFLATLFFLFIVFALIRAIFWRGGSGRRGGWGPGGWGG